MKKSILIVCVIILIIILIALLYIFNINKIEREGAIIPMEYEFDSMIGLENLDLYYEAHLVDLDGECFIYRIYLDEEVNNEKFEEIKKAVEVFSEDFDFNGDNYPGYIDVSLKENNILIFLDLGNVLPQNQNISIQGILKTINKVKGIKKVMINEF